MNQSYDPYENSDERRYQRGRRRSQTSSTGNGTAHSPSDSNRATQTSYDLPAQTSRPAVGRRGTRSTPVANPNPPTEMASREQIHTPAKRSNPHQRHREPRTHLETKAGTVRVSGRVVSYKPSQRRNDFFHVMYDTLVKGTRLSFSPVMQVINVELNDMDYTNIDSDSRHTVIVTMVGKVYDGAVSVKDYIDVTGHWSPNHTISASSVYNQTNGSHLAVSHGIPANLARVLTVVVLILLTMMMMWLFGSSSPLPAIGNSLYGLFQDILPYLMVLILLWWFIAGLRGPTRSIRRLFSRLLRLAVGIAIIWYVATAYSWLLYYLLIAGIILAGIRIMISAV